MKPTWTQQARKIAPRASNETKMDPKCSPKGALETSKRPLGAESGFRMLFGVILGPPNRPKWSWNLTNNQAPIWRYLFGYLEASGGRLGLDLGVILGSILGSRTRHAIFAKNSTAPQRERFGGSKNEPKRGPKIASSGNLAPRASWEPLGLDVGAFWGPFLAPKSIK